MRVAYGLACTRQSASARRGFGREKGAIMILPRPVSVLVTGGAGYLGSQLIADLASDPAVAAVRVFDNMSTGRHDALMDLVATKPFEFIEGDILDGHGLDRVLMGIDVVIHLAACVRTPLSFDNAAMLQQVNHWGTATLVEHCLSAKVGRLI